MLSCCKKITLKVDTGKRAFPLIFFCPPGSKRSFHTLRYIFISSKSVNVLCFVKVLPEYGKRTKYSFQIRIAIIIFGFKTYRLVLQIFAVLIVALSNDVYGLVIIGATIRFVSIHIPCSPYINDIVFVFKLVLIQRIWIVKILRLMLLDLRTICPFHITVDQWSCLR